LQSRSRVQSLHEVVFSLNLVTAIGYTSLVYADKKNLDYYLLRAAIRIDDILHFAQANAVTTEALRRHSQNSATLFAGMEIATLISVLAAALIVLLFLRLCPNSWYCVIVGNRCSGVLALFALPLAYLCTLFWQADSGAAVQTDMRLFWFLVAADVLLFAILSLMFQVRPLSAWTIGILLVFHCAFWLTNMSRPLSVAAGGLSFFLFVFPLSAATWLLNFTQTQRPAVGTVQKGNVGTWTVASAVVSGAIVLVIWYPGKAYGLAHPRNIGSVSIEMSRGPCYGLCPSYSLTLHGDGLVEYRGSRFVRVREKQTTKISSEQLMQVLRDLDSMDFFTVEDRAFQWCYDSPSTSISVSVDGRYKSVTTDGCSILKNTGPMAKFFQIADEIDAIADSKQWVQCNGLCPN
jgi:hypothetical protein